MTPEQFKALLALEIKKQQEALAEFKKLLKDPQYKPTSAELSAYCKHEDSRFGLYQSISTDDLKEQIKEFEAQIKQHKKKLNFNSGINLTAIGYDDNAEIDEFELKATWYEPYDKDSPIFEARAKAICREELKKAIRTKAAVPTAYFNVDCKLVGLWLDNKIDFATLAEISTAQCKL